MADVRLVSESNSSVDLEYVSDHRADVKVDIGLRRRVDGMTSIIEGSRTAALIRVGSLDSLKLEILSEDPVVEPDGPDGTEEGGVWISSRGIYRGQAFVRIEFSSEANGKESKRTQVRLSWAEDFPQAEQESIGELPEARSFVKHMSNPALKVDPIRLQIPITETGIFEFTIGETATAAGLEVDGLDAENLGLAIGETQIPFELYQEDSTRLSASDLVLFYGIHAGSHFTRTNVYWLNLSSSERKRIENRDGTPEEGLPTPGFFPTTRREEKDLHIWQTMPGGTEVDRWFWGNRLTAYEQRSYPLTAPFPAASENPFQVRVALQGLSFSPFHAVDHRAAFMLNGVSLGEHTWNDRDSTVKSLKLPGGILNEIENEFSIEAIRLPELVLDQFFVNWIELTYDRQYVAHGDRLVFGVPAPGRYTFDVDGFPNSDVDVLDISQAYSPERISHYKSIDSERGQSIRFTSAAPADAQFLAQSVSLRKRVEEMSVDEPSRWKSSINGADYIVITHEEFETAAEKLCSFRKTQGLRTAVVLVRDIYDEFSEGRFDPRAIRDFLSYAYHEWRKPAPMYVVLMGDAYLDYLDRLGTGSINYVPSQQVSTSLLGLTVSDNWYAQVDGEDQIPDLFLGRVPATTELGAERFVNRLIQYETEPADEEWRSRVAFIADDGNVEFEALSDRLSEALPRQIDAVKWYASEHQGETQNREIIGLFEEGHALISYTGHGTVASWGISGEGEVLLSGGVAGQINPDGRWPVVTTANCLNGFFAARNSRPSLAEILLNSKTGGAIAVWAPTSLGFPEGHRILMEHFYEQVFKKRQERIGPATTAAQIATFVEDSKWLELMETYVLFGDPAMRLRFGLSPEDPLINIASASGGALELQYETDPNFDYTLYAVDDLTSEVSWEALPNGPHNTGIHTISTADYPHSRFFKLIVTPKHSAVEN